MSPASPASPCDKRTLVEPDPLLWHHALWLAAACAMAASLFLWAAGYFPRGRPLDVRLAVAACWDSIEQKQPSGSTLHDMRVACQRLESDSARPPSQLLASGD